MSLLTSVLFHSGLMCARAAQVFNALAAGTITRADLRAGIARDWEGFNALPEEVFGGLLPWERALVDRVIRPGGRVLIIGSGTGREVIALAERGQEVVGIDPSGPAVAAAATFLTERGVAATVREGFYEDAEIPGSFDLVFFSHRCYSLIPGSAARIAVLVKARGALRPGGRIVVSWLTGRGVRPILTRLTRFTSALTRTDLRAEPGDDFYRIGETPPYFGYEHHFAPGEFEAEARAAGLDAEMQEDRGCPAAILRIPAAVPAAARSASP